MLSPLIAAIQKTVQPNAADVALCEAAFEPLSATRNQTLQKSNTVPTHLYFVASGFVRLFYPSPDGAEVTTHLASPGNFITPFLSFIHGSPATEAVQTVTDCELLRISKPQLAGLIDQSEAFKKFSLVIFEQAVAVTQSRANDLATLNAEERYRKLLREQPSVAQYVPVQYIASYLGMQPESLSRIRRQIIS